jgi:hypothetical protein
MLQFSDIILSFFSVLGFLTLSLLLGKGLELMARKKGNTHSLGLFWQLLSGTFLLISFYAIFSTKGISIFLITPILLFFFVKEKLNYSDVSSVTFKRHLPFFVCSVLVNFGFYLWAINSFSPDYVAYVSGDFNIYFRIAQRLNEFGIESLNLDPIYSATYASPYHYGDIWAYALVSKLVSINPSAVFLIVFTHFSVIFINGIFYYSYSRFSTYLSGKSAYLYLLLIAGLFTGFNIFFPKFIIPSAEPYTLSVMNWSKVLVPSCFLISLLILSKEKTWRAFILLAMIGGLSFINSLPAIFMTVFLMLTINLIRKNISPKQWFLYHLCYVGITVIFIVFLYKLLPGLLGLKAKEATGVEIEKAIDIKMYLTTAIKIFIGGWFQLFVLTPFFLIFLTGLMISGKWKKLKNSILNLDNDILFMICVVLSGLSCWALLHPFAPDAVQFYTNILAPVYAMVISFLTMYVLYVFRSRVLSFITIAALVLCLFIHKADIFFINKHDRIEWNALKSFLTKKNVGSNFVNLRPINHFESFFDKNTIYFMPLGFLNYLWPNYHNFSLNAPFIQVNESSPYANEERIEINLAPFTIYYKDKRRDSGTDVEAIVNSFIQEQKVGYISVSKDTVLPQYFRNLVKDSLNLEKANFVVYRIK